MIGAGIPKKPLDPLPEAPPKAPGTQPRTGSGADTALEALIRKRPLQSGSEPAPPGDGSRTLPAK
jgi:hypothetical protein